MVIEMKVKDETKNLQINLIKRKIEIESVSKIEFGKIENRAK
jgi:hypothetical protein